MQLLGAAAAGNEAAVVQLLAAGASPHARAVRPADANNAAVIRQGLSDATPLHMAARCGSLGAMRALLNSGADVNACCLDGLTPLHIAAWNGHAAAVRLLLQQRGLRVGAVSRGTDAAQFASMNGHADVLDALLRAAPSGGGGGAPAPAATAAGGANSSPPLPAPALRRRAA